MAAQTTTIRVTRATRDLLTAQARQRGLSVAALLAEMARERERVAIWESERRASRMDAANPEAQQEHEDWDSTVADGID